MRQRRQKEVQKVYEYYYDFLREGLPPGPIREEAFNPHPSPNPCKLIETVMQLILPHFNMTSYYAQIPTHKQ